MTKTMKPSRVELVTPRNCFHLASWIGLVATAWTNLESAPSAGCRVAYLVIPLMAACISEGLIKAWSEIHVGIRLFVGLVLAGLLATSYEHFSDFIRLSGGTSFSVHVGAAMVDAAILACVVTTCSLPDAKSKPRTRAVVEPKPKPAPKPEPKLAPKPAGGQRAENDRRDVETMRRLWPDLEFFTLSETERLAAVRKGMQCGGSRANRLIKLFESHLQSEIMGN